MLIRGKFFENNKWIEKVVNYPDVIYDCLNGTDKNNNIYEEFQSIPIMNETYESDLNTLNIYEVLAQSNFPNEYLLPFKSVDKVKEIVNFIEQNKKVTLQPRFKSSSTQHYYIEKLEALEYLVIENGNEKRYNKLTLEHFLKEALKKEPVFRHQ
ncbi:hypothetical protein [Piscibacillus salipiscarius]|uniref:hypothetical protein n=1 Tax=Piscibacillus salipiscarius TaxID=299480 RepID=UPI0006D26BAD|nr:hypothetical protein [Piscibacillus salipiscarius]